MRETAASSAAAGLRCLALGRPPLTLSPLPVSPPAGRRLGPHHGLPRRRARHRGRQGRPRVPAARRAHVCALPRHPPPIPDHVRRRPAPHGRQRYDHRAAQVSTASRAPAGSKRKPARSLSLLCHHARPRCICNTTTSNNSNNNRATVTLLCPCPRLLAGAIPCSRLTWRRRATPSGAPWRPWATPTA